MVKKNIASSSMNKIIDNKQFTREDFTRILQKCHNTIRNNDKLSPEAAFDEISKILFIKIGKERVKETGGIYTLAAYKEEEAEYERLVRPALRAQGVDIPYMQEMFNETKRKYKDDRLFEQHDIIRVRQNSFEQILTVLQAFNLSNINDDVKGIAFEKFLGTTFRGELGQYFTPRTVVDFMTNILDPQEGEIVCDPTCGSGGFLIKAFEYVRGQIEKDVNEAKRRLFKELRGKSYSKLPTNERKLIDKRIQRICDLLDSELDTHKYGSRMYNLSHKCIYGTDANPRMARTSKMNMIMHGDGHGGVHHHDGLLNVNGIFEERFDVILTNPPFGARIDRNQRITEADKFSDERAIARYRKEYGDKYDEALRQVNGHIGDRLLSLFETGSMSSLTEVLFLERCLRLLKKGGRMGIVLPEGVLNNTNLQRVREYFEERAKIILICSIPHDVFVAAGATVKPSILFLRRFTEAEEQRYAECKRIAIQESAVPYKEDIDSLTTEYRHLRDAGKLAASRAKDISKRLDDIDKHINENARRLVKKYFDYEIPVAKVDDAGIMSTGAESLKNQLPVVEREYKEYRKTNQPWVVMANKVRYRITVADGVARIVGGKEIRLNVNK